MTLLPNDIREHSVTRDDPAVLNPGGRPQTLYITLPTGYLNSPTGVLPADLPLPWSRARDRILLTLPLHESMWAAAMQKAMSKQAALGFTVKDRAEDERRSAIGQERLLTANGGRGWVSFIFQHLADYLGTDNGAFVELIYRSQYLRSQFLGFMHLDSLRCTRTGDPEIPVVYEDLNGRVHELRAHQVLTFVDMESARAEARGTGLCAASRAYNKIHTLAAMERYVDEKISGTRPKGIHLVNGLSQVQLEGALNGAAESARNKGMVQYMGAAIIALTAMTTDPKGYYIPIAEIPDGFDAKQERDNTYLVYANCLGVPVTDIQPLSGQGLGTGQQSVVIDEAAEGQGMAAWRKQWEHGANGYILPSSTTFTWTNVNDAREQAQKAETDNKRIQSAALLVEKIGMAGNTAQQLLADQGVIPDSFLVEDETPDDQLTDVEKPVDEADRAAMEASAPPVGGETEEQVEGKADWAAQTVQALEDAARTLKVHRDTVTKAARATRITDPSALFDDATAMAAAKRMVEEARG